eukprot:4068124-Pyramimonas_sp.AAC.1
MLHPRPSSPHRFASPSVLDDPIDDVTAIIEMLSRLKLGEHDHMWGSLHQASSISCPFPFPVPRRPLFRQDGCHRAGADTAEGQGSDNNR